MQIYKSRNQRYEISDWGSNETFTWITDIRLILLLFYQTSPASFDG